MTPIPFTSKGSSVLGLCQTIGALSFEKEMNMELCIGGKGKSSHTEIVHDESTCPLCVVMSERDELELKIEKLDAEIDRLNSEE